MRIYAPCKECKERCPGCHTECEPYKEFRQSRDAIAKKKQAENDSTPEMTPTMKKNLRRKLRGW
jgi:hypothetical protein